MNWLARTSKDAKHSKISVDFIKSYSKDAVPEMELVEELKIIQAVLLKQLPPERISGFINIIYAMRPSASEKEIESALVSVVLSVISSHQFSFQNSFLKEYFNSSCFRTIFTALKRKLKSFEYRM